MNIQKENALQQIKNLFDELSTTVLRQLELLEKIVNGSATSIPEDLLEELNANELRIDQYEIQITDEIIDTIVLQKPVASDLRQVMAAYQMVSNLERIGDSVMNIVRYIPRIQEADVYLKMSEVITNMLSASVSMVQKSILSFTSLDKGEAIWTIKNDVEVDALNREIYDRVKGLLRERPDDIETLIALLNVSRHLERIADHATNIAEASIYAIEGRDLRHQKEIDE